LTAGIATTGRDLLNTRLKAQLVRAGQAVATCNAGQGNRAAALGNPQQPTENDFAGFWTYFQPNMVALAIALPLAVVATLGLTVAEFFLTKGDENRLTVLFGVACGACMFAVALLVIGAASPAAWVWGTVRNSPSSSALSTPVLLQLSYVSLLVDSAHAGALSLQINVIGLSIFGLVRCCSSSA
jgi:hypothetical protein